MVKRKTNPASGAERSGRMAPPASGRVRALLFFVFVVGILIMTRLFVLQFVGADKWRALAENQQSVSAELVPDRGELYFREGEAMYPAAVNREYPLLYLVPGEIENVAATAEALSGAVGIPSSDIREKCQNLDNRFAPIKKKLTDDEASRVAELGLKGVYLRKEKVRYYPGGSLAGQVVGFVSPGDPGKGDKGRYGLESWLDDLLRGKPGMVEQKRDAGGRWISTDDRVMIPAEEGPDVVLTIDHVIQHEAEEILRDSVEKYAGDGGSIVVMEPSTGRILAMASDPSFDPNEYGKTEDYARFLNPTVSMTYEPGSTMKPITMAIGIDEGKVEPDTAFFDPGSVSISGYTLKNAEGKTYGKTDMYGVLDNSINTGVIHVESLVGNARFADRMSQFGFGQKTGIDLPAELGGNMRNLSDIRRDIQFYTASFGQGITTTPLQLIDAYGALANKGVLMKPRIVEKYVYGDGREEVVEPEEVRPVVSSETAEKMGKMLEDVVLRGHGKRAAVPGYRVGGKTGTAQVAKEGGGGYEDGLSIGSFVGYAPIGDPKFVVLTKVDNPKNVEWAESSAAPMFGSMMKFLLSYAKVEPTELIPAQK
ncbi:MAG: penicillin-binding protein 2 [Candidatus Moranbacteria bacterium]|nr:penicillin-binding protein 2 [Candidatus Moranbacteria bacterium]NTW89958.1 penicillin-binding protein 2 [Candidatus Moranbacteria bacterium]